MGVGGLCGGRAVMQIKPSTTIHTTWTILGGVCLIGIAESIDRYTWLHTVLRGGEE